MRRLLSRLCCWDSLWHLWDLVICRSTQVLLGRPQCEASQAQGPTALGTCGYTQSPPSLA